MVVAIPTQMANSCAVRLPNVAVKTPVMYEIGLDLLSMILLSTVGAEPCGQVFGVCRCRVDALFSGPCTP